MQYVTEEYREQMHTRWRGHSSTFVYIGLINSDAQQTAHITSSFSGSEANLYDGSARGMVTSTENDGSITFTFDFYELNIAGLTIQFGATVHELTVTNGQKTVTIVIDDDELTLDSGFDNCHYLTITPDTGKLKVKSIQFGIGIQFTDTQIIHTSRNNIVSHISAEIPTKKFSFTINNRSNDFSRDNPYGYSNYLQEKQEVVFEYGREMPDGSVYKIKGGKVLLQNWTSDDYEATFSCVGYLDYLEGKYNKGKVYPEGISAFELAKLVFQDAGITNYKLDESMKRIQIFNPIPVCEYREALKMIANASMCVLYEDRDGNICMTNSNMPSFIFTCEFTGATNYCIPTAIFDDNSLYNYADAEHEYVYADGTLLFLPEDNSYRQVGFVSSQIANSSGLFTNDPHIDITFKSEFTMSELIMNFAVVVPTSVTVTFKLRDTVVNTQTLTNLSLSEKITYSGTIDAMTIAFNGATPNQRIHLNNLVLNGKIDYELTYQELKDTPIASSLDKISKINVHSYQFNEEKTEEGTSHNSYVKVDYIDNDDGGQTADITTGSSDYGSAISTIHAQVGENLVTFGAPYYNYKATAGTITESGAYYLIISSDIEQDIDIYAQPYSVTDNVISVNVHEKGVEKDSRNPLVSSNIMAKQQLEWLKDYYDDDLEYNLTYRGDPILDADDLIYLENKFVANNEVRIVDETINTSIGMDFSCRIRARRTSYQTDSTTSRAIVGRVKLGEVL